MALAVDSKIIILDFGSQYSHLIVRRCRECSVYSELLPCDTLVETIKAFRPIGIILSGGPASVYEDHTPHVQTGFWAYVHENSIPILGICYGMQDTMQHFGGKVEPATHREFGHADLTISTSDPLFEGLERQTVVWMSHGDIVTQLPPGFRVIASSHNCELAAVVHEEHRIWGVQFHPEVTHTLSGKIIINNFVHTICGAPANSWNMEKFATREIEQIRQQVGNRHVIGAISGGVDSTVAAALLQRAIGERFHGFMVDTGLLRKDEGKEVHSRLQRIIPGLSIVLLNETETFLEGLKGVTEPEHKRKLIGHMFVKSFMDAVDLMKKLYPSGTFDDAFLLQGTLYPDVIESVSFKGPSHTIKTHHNVGGLPTKMKLELLEPLRELFKDEVRSLGVALNLEPSSIWRHPFPGPGLAIRIIGEVTKERADILRAVDAIYIEELRLSGDYERIGQAFSILLPDCRSVGVMGDQRTYGMTVVLRAIETSDFMTGEWYDMPRNVLKKCSTRIINEVQDVNRVCYDISSKPPATIEWE